MESVKTFPNDSKQMTPSRHQHGLHTLQERSQGGKAEPLDACLVYFLHDSCKELAHMCSDVYDFGASDRHLVNALKHLPAMEFQMRFLDKQFLIFGFFPLLQSTEWQRHRSLLGLQNAGSVTLRLLCEENILLRPFGQRGFMCSFISHPCFKIILCS